MSESGFIGLLRALAARDDRGALAALRRGLVGPPGSAPEMQRYVAPFLPPGPWGWAQECHYVAAALFGMHPDSGGNGDMGHVFRRIADASGGDSTEKRFVALLKCDREDLFDHLRQGISLAKSKGVPVNWERLLVQIQRWDDDSGWVQREWSISFWGSPAAFQEEAAGLAMKGATA